MLAVIGGSGLSRLDILQGIKSVSYQTPYAQAQVEILEGSVEGLPVAFLPRHGADHKIPPHRINYRANLWALKEHGVTGIIAVNAVGGIDPQMSPGKLAIPDQLIDYTSGRAHTFYEENLEEVVHVDFTHPYSKRLRQLLVIAVEEEQMEEDESEEEMPMTRGVYGCTQGPRLETAAEVARMRKDGCDMVGMTGMPEAALARELGLQYACLALSVNRAAGLEEGPITMDAINQTLATGMKEVKRVLQVFFRLYRERTVI
ncbi:MAG: S-methyl-5'-thioinosine phosphorylase [Gammaproteobacteria bacterium]|nr:S-methyl-5'-thioinosine phosphorylase [Pseudomonadales bacterium]